MTLVWAAFGILLGQIDPENKIPAVDRTVARQRTVSSLESVGIDLASHESALEAIWDGEGSSLDAVVYSLAECHESVRASVEAGVPDRFESWELPAFVTAEDSDPFLRSNVALWFALRMVQSEMFDEAIELLGKVREEDVVDPAGYYYAGALSHFHLGQREEAITSIQLLLRVEGAPQRYMAMAGLLGLDITQRDPASLGGVAREMRDIRRRLDLGKTDKKVRDIEDGVLNKLDTMIEELEKQQQQQQQQPGNSLQPNKPMDDSRPAGGEGEGKVDPKKLPLGDKWGNLPPKERERALQDIGRDLPGHYRSAIEQYFRKLPELPPRKGP